jgi:methyl-accepting chemotaxis protein
MLDAMSNIAIRGRLLAAFALICVLLAATVGYTVYAMSDICAGIGHGAAGPADSSAKGCL